MTHLGPYELDSVHLGDCIELMKQLPDKCVVTITDPVWPNVSPKLIGADDPYGLFERAIIEIERISIRIAIQLGCNSDPRFLAPVSMKFNGLLPLRNVPAYDRGGSNIWGDVVYLFGSCPDSRRFPDLCKISSHFDKDKTIDHPCPRKLPHVKHIVSNWSDKSETILDPFSGSGTTGVAAIQTGRRFLGFEIDPRWVDLANKRIEAAKAQQTLDLL